jgi:c-di-GMP-binding flagellar brake protein YcgR
MQGLLDLTHRQAVRVLEQALRARGRVEIEPCGGDRTIGGYLVAREGGLLRVDLHDHGRDWPLTPLVGAFCEVSMVLSGQMYRFSSCIVTAEDGAAAQRLMLSAPAIVQVCNRRRYDRRSYSESPAIQVFTQGHRDPLVGTLSEIGLGGLACNLPAAADEELLIDDGVRLRFRLPGREELFELSACVCLKNAAHAGDDITVGLEFCPDTPGAEGLARLRQALAQEYAGGCTGDDGDAASEDES